MKKVFKASAAGLIIAALLSSTVFARCTVISVGGKDGKAYDYKYEDLKASATEAILHGQSSPDAKLYEDFLARKDTVKAFFDDTKNAYVDYSVVSAAETNAILNNKPFDFNSFLEARTTPTTTLTTAKVTADANGNVSVASSTGSSGGSSSSGPWNSSNLNPVQNVSTVSAINLTAIKVTFDSSVTDAIAAKTNYTLSQGIVESAVKTGDKEVTLSVSGLGYEQSTTLTVVNSLYSKQIKMPSVNDLYALVINSDDGDTIKSDGISKTTLSASIVDKATGNVVIKDAVLAFSKTSGSLTQGNVVMQNGKAATQLTSMLSATSVTSIVTATVLSCSLAPEFIGLTTQKTITFVPMFSPVSAGCDRGDRFYVKFSGNISAADYKNVVTSPNWSGHPFGIQYKGASQEYKDIKVADVYNKTPDTLMFVLDTDDIGSDTPSIAPTIGQGSGQLEIMDSSFEGTGTVGNYLKNGVSHTIAFPDDITGVAEKSSDITFTLSDTVNPSVSTVDATTSTAITISATEPLAQNLVETTADDTINSHFTIDGKAVRLVTNPELLTTEKINYAKANNEIIVTWLCVGEYYANESQVEDSRNIINIEIDENFALSAGNHHMQITNIGDYAGNTDTQELDFNVNN